MLTRTTLRINPIIPTRGIYYIGQYGTSGYATAAKGYIYHHFSSGLPITWDPLYFDNSKLEETDPYNMVVKSLIGKDIDNDMVIMHSTPDLWPNFRQTKYGRLNGRILIGHFHWESNMLPDGWVENINSCVNEVWVSSKYNMEACKNSGVTIPVRVVPCIFLPRTLPEKNRIQLMTCGDKIISDEGRYTFYTIGELSPRKSILETIDIFCKAFTDKDNVRFIVKTHYKDYSKESINYCLVNISSVLDKYPNHAPVHVILQNLRESDILGLHSIGDCYVALSKSEGFGLPIHDAHNYGKKVITTGYSSPVEFLGDSYPGLVKYELGQIPVMEGYYMTKAREGEVWAYPSPEHALDLMRKMYEDSGL